jgi:hypothetical protein
MSRIAAKTNLSMARGSTWLDYLDYYEDDGETPIDLDGYQARLQVWPEDGLYTGETPLLDLSTEGATPRLFIEAIADSGSLAKNRVRIDLPKEEHADLNPDNEERIAYGFGVLLTLPGTPDFDLPYARGRLDVYGAEVRD